MSYYSILILWINASSYRFPVPFRSRDRISVQWLGCRLDNKGNMARFPTCTRQYSRLQSIQTNSGVNSDSYSMGNWALPSEVKQPGHKADYPPSHTAEVKKACSFSSTAPSRYAKEQLYVSMYLLSLRNVKILIPDSHWISWMFSFHFYTQVVIIHIVTTLFLYHPLADTRLIK